MDENQATQETKKILEGKCPSCSAGILYSLSNDSVTCPCCDHIWRVSDLGSFSADSSVGGASANAADNIIVNIDSPDSALIFFDNYVSKYDWSDFLLSPDLSLPSLNKLVENQLLKNATSPIAWEMQFRSVFLPLAKKLESLGALARNFCLQYVNSDDITDAMASYDTYVIITSAVIVKRDELLSVMATAIKNAMTYKIAEEEANKMKAGYMKIKNAIVALTPIGKYQELPGYQEAEATKQQRIAAELAKVGINAEEYYTAAVTNYNNGNRSIKLLQLFEKIKKYKDSEVYYKKLNTYVGFGDGATRFLRLKDSFFNFSKQESTFLVSSFENAKQEAMKKLEHAKTKRKRQKAIDEMPDDSSVGTYKLYPVIGGEVSEIPTINGITQILTHYGDNLFFIKGDRALCMYDNTVRDPNTCVKELVTAGRDAFKDGNQEYSIIIRENFMFIRQELKGASSKKGCLSKFRKKKNVDEISNNFAVLRVDLATGQVAKVINEVVDIQNVVGDLFVYSSIVTNDIGVKVEQNYIYDYKKNASAKILDSNSQIAAVIGTKVIYMLWIPCQENKDLYSLDLATRKSVLLESNVYDYYKTINDNVYYMVGNERDMSLFSIAPDGTGKVEIMQKAESVSNATLINGWLYITKGSFPNTALIKVSADGKKTVFLCNGFRKSVYMGEGFIYFLSTRDELCRVRVDGRDCCTLVSNVREVISVDADAIYFTRRELSEDGYTNSLYKADNKGHNLKKLAFDLKNAKVSEHNKDEVYITRGRLQTYSVSTLSRGSKNYKHQPDIEKAIQEFLLYSKSEGTFKLIATLGKPKKEDITVRSGCLKRPKKPKDVIITPVNNKIVLRVEGTASAGDISRRQKSVEEQEQMRAMQQMEEKNKLLNQFPLRGCGCLSKKKKK